MTGLRIVAALSCLHASAIAQVDTAFEPTPSRITSGIAEGSAALTPNEFTPAAIGDYTLTLTVGAAGIVEGGGLLVDFPKTWFTNPVPTPKVVQTGNPDNPHFVDVTVSRRNVKVAVRIDGENFDGKMERFRKIVNIALEAGALREGDTVAVAFRNTTCPYISGEDGVAVAVDAAGSGEFRLIADRAPYEVRPGEMRRTRIVVPSQAVVNEPVTIQAVNFDLFDNVAPVGGHLEANVYGDKVRLMSTPESPGIYRGTWTPSEAVIASVETSTFAPDIPPDDFPKDRGGPIRVYESEPELKVYWGDLHSHSDISKDGIGTDDWSYARDVARLDFYGSSEHDVNDAGKDSITPAEWETIRTNVRDYYAPGEFVTLLGYECSLPGGHHNVFYRGMDGVPWPGHRLAAVEAVWAKLKANDAITIPHHPGIRWGGFQAAPKGPELQPIETAPRRPRGGPQVDWSRAQNDALRPLVEIYSKHGQSEFFDPDDPLSYEQVRFTPAHSAEGPHYAQDAWAMGVHVGAMASSDNHCAHPGLAHTGLTAVFARELTRDAIFDALLARRCYATTGERILMEFEVNGAMMGEAIEAGDTIEVRMFVAAPGAIAFAEVLMVAAGSTEWRVVKRGYNARSNATAAIKQTVIDTTFELPAPEEGATLYLRCELDKETNGRVARAWSSPIWVNRAD